MSLWSNLLLKHTCVSIGAHIFLNPATIGAWLAIESYRWAIFRGDVSIKTHRLRAWSNHMVSSWFSTGVVETKWVCLTFDRNTLALFMVCLGGLVAPISRTTCHDGRSYAFHFVFDCLEKFQFVQHILFSFWAAAPTKFRPPNTGPKAVNGPQPYILLLVGKR